MEKKYLGLMVLIITLIVVVIIITQRVNLEEIGTNYGYLGIFGISLVSCMTIVFPIPYIPALIAISPFFNPFWMGIFGGTGAALGEFTGYVLGRSGVKTFPERWRNIIGFLERFFSKYGFWSILLVTATPLPVGIMFLVAGVARYSILKLLAAGIMGKIIFVWAMAIFGHHLYPFSFEVILAILLIIVVSALLIYFFRSTWLKHLRELYSIPH